MNRYGSVNGCAHNKQKERHTLEAHKLDLQTVIVTKKFDHELLDKHQHNTANKINQTSRAMYHNITNIVAKSSKMNR